MSERVEFIRIQLIDGRYHYLNLRMIQDLWYNPNVDQTSIQMLNSSNILLASGNCILDILQYNTITRVEVRKK